MRAAAGKALPLARLGRRSAGLRLDGLNSPVTLEASASGSLAWGLLGPAVASDLFSLGFSVAQQWGLSLGPCPGQNLQNTPWGDGEFGSSAVQSCGRGSRPGPLQAMLIQ